MFCETVTRRVVLVASLAFLINGGATMFAQVESSTFYSTYDARELVKNRNYKGIEFAYGEMGGETSILKGRSELPKEDSEKTKSVSYGCRLKTTGDDAFNVADFLDWLMKETIKQIENAKGTVVGQRHKVGRRFQVEYAQNGFTGRVEVYAEYYSEGSDGPGR